MAAPTTTFPTSFEDTCEYCGIAIAWWEDQEIYVPADSSYCSEEEGHYPR